MYVSLSLTRTPIPKEDSKDSLVLLDDNISPHSITHNVLTPIQLKQNDHFYTVVLTQLNSSL